MHRFMRQIKKFRLTVTVWNEDDEFMNLAVFTNESNFSDKSSEWHGELRNEAGLEGVDATIALLEALLQQARDLRPMVEKQESFSLW